MVDTADSKSAEGNLMPVRVRPPLPEDVERVCRFSANSFLVSYAEAIVGTGPTPLGAAFHLAGHSPRSPDDLPGEYLFCQPLINYPLRPFRPAITLP